MELDYFFGFYWRGKHVILGGTWVGEKGELVWDFVFWGLLRLRLFSFKQYLHLFKAIFLCLLFDSSLIVWLVGFIIFIFIVLIAFIGYILPATSMSYWGLTVLSNVLATVPIIGIWLCYWVWGSEYISDFTLLKMHSLHVFLPFVLLFVVIFHLFCIHYFLSSDGLYDRFSFYYERFFFFSLYYIRDTLLFLNIVLCLSYVVCINWYFVFHEESWIIVDVLKTSDKILPEFWTLGKRHFCFISFSGIFLGGFLIFWNFGKSFLSILFWF